MNKYWHSKCVSKTNLWKLVLDKAITITENYHSDFVQQIRHNSIITFTCDLLGWLLLESLQNIYVICLEVNIYHLSAQRSVLLTIHHLTFEVCLLNSSRSRNKKKASALPWELLWSIEMKLGAIACFDSCSQWQFHWQRWQSHMAVWWSRAEQRQNCSALYFARRAFLARPLEKTPIL